ncbi:5'-nucleotidase [Kangiella sp. TOML190]|uniref:5'-nucleotidase n=1 Tax=Kangiella sp. TOML190 TaxID=2931351 RepID=UPI00204121BF|nr:5'-nucleotidase [Kangiella sp. TOML190]
MPIEFNDTLVIAISSTALFNLADSHRVYLEKGVTSYAQYQIDHEDELLKPGAAFGLVKKLLALNEATNTQPRVEVILLSRNSADTGLRVFNSIENHQLQITRAAFTSGNSPYQYASAFNAHLFLSTNPVDVKQALDNGIAAATIVAPITESEHSSEIRFAFDGDAVLFSDEAEKIYQQSGLEEFTKHEKASAQKPLEGGPFKNFLAALHKIQKDYGEDCPIRTALVTARSAPAHERVIRTLRYWNIRIDEALFLGGMDKTPFLKAFAADVFFDDQEGHIERARDHIASAHVPTGIVNSRN